VRLDCCCFRNAAHPRVDYPRTAASIIADANAALATGSRATMLALKNAFDRITIGAARSTELDATLPHPEGQGRRPRHLG
jgi:hypothetical protein